LPPFAMDLSGLALLLLFALGLLFGAPLFVVVLGLLAWLVVCGFRSDDSRELSFLYPCTFRVIVWTIGAVSC
jgi:hypothetical protein